MKKVTKTKLMYGRREKKEVNEKKNDNEKKNLIMKL